MQARHGQLTANTVATVTFGSTAADSETVEVTNRDGTAEIFFTAGDLTGTNAIADPTVAGNDTYFLPAAIGSLRVTVGTTGQVTVKLISAGTPKYTVTRLDGNG